MKNIFFILGTLAFFSESEGQSLKGFYTGQMKVPGESDRMQIQLDLLEEDGGYRGVFRSRFVENNTVTGCDNWVEGQLNGKSMVLRNLATTRETGVPAGTCKLMKQIRLSLSGKTNAPEFNCTWELEEGEVFGRFTLIREDTAVSYYVEEEREMAYKYMADNLIFMARSDSVRLGLMLRYRPLSIRDTIEVATGDIELVVSSPEADPFHLLTLVVNNMPVAIRRSTSQQPLRVKINTVEFPEANIVFLCEHALVNVFFNTEVIIKSGDSIQKIVIPVSTYQNAGFFLKAIPTPSTEQNH